MIVKIRTDILAKREAARERQESTLPKEGQKGFQPVNAVQNFAQHTDIKDADNKTRTKIAEVIGLGSGEQWRKHSARAGRNLRIKMILRIQPRFITRARAGRNS